MRAKKIVNQSSDFPVRRTGLYHHKKSTESVCRWQALGMLLLLYASHEIGVQPLNGCFISRLKTVNAIVQFIDKTGLHDVGRCVSVTTDAQLRRWQASQDAQ